MTVIVLPGTRVQQILAVVSVVAFIQIILASITTRNVTHLNLSWEHQEETVAGCNTLTSFMAVVYTGMATAVLTGWLNKFYTNPEKWHLALSTSSFWMGAMYIQSGIVSHGYLAQALLSEAVRLWSAEATAALRASYILAHVLGVAYIVLGGVLLGTGPVPHRQEYEPLGGMP